MYLVVTVGVGLAALNTGNNLLYLVLGFLLSLIVASGVLSERVLKYVSVRRLLPEGAYAGEPFAMRYEVTRSQGVAFALSLSEANLQGSAFVAVVHAKQPQVARANLTAGARGPLQLTEVRVTTEFPLGLFAKTRAFELPELLLVYPRRGMSCAEPPELAGAPAGDGGNPRRRDGTGDLLGLRELQSGEDSRRVHWLKSAAAGKLLRVEREREERRQFVLEVHGPSGAALDQRCEEVAAQSQRLLAKGHEVGLTTDTSRIRPGSGPGQQRRLLAALAWAGFERPAAEPAP